MCTKKLAFSFFYLDGNRSYVQYDGSRMHMPQKFKDVVKFLGKLFPPTSDLEYILANLTVLAL